MKAKLKKGFLLTFVICFALALSACGNKQEFEYVRGFEQTFLKEEYEDEYNKVEKSIELEDDANYQISIKSVCESGTIEIKVNYTTVEGEMKIVEFSAPCDETIMLTEGMTKGIEFTITIVPETEGSVEVDIFSDNP